MYYILSKEIQESYEGLGDYILKISTNIEELLEWINIKIEEKEYSDICTFFKKTSPLTISAKPSGNEIFPFFTDFTSVP